MLMAEPSNIELVEIIDQAHKKIEELDNNVKYLTDAPTDFASNNIIKCLQDSRLLIEKELKLRKRIWKSCVQLVKHGIQPKDVNNFLVC
ncbi:Hop2 [Kluyveromyces lactis]|nr:Hop2 [Kluyveromyces lactis]